MRRKRKNQSAIPYSLSKNATINSVVHRAEGSELAPLPADIMECNSVLSLTTTTTSSETGETVTNSKQNQKTKKEKRDFKKDRWKKSK